MKQKNKYPANYLDFVPECAPDRMWSQTEAGLVVVEARRTGFYDKLAQCAFRRPASSYVDLDDLGSFIWLQMDGQRSIYEIALLVREQFGQRAEPLLRRIIAFFRLLESYRFVRFQGNFSAEPQSESHFLQKQKMYFASDKPEKS